MIKQTITAEVAAEECFDGITICFRCAECKTVIEQYTSVEKFKPTSEGMVGVEMEVEHQCSEAMEHYLQKHKS